MADTSSKSPSANNHPKRILKLGEAVVLIVGLVIGSGIFKAPSGVAAMSGDSGNMLAAWILGGVISLIGALCYAELATAFPHTGGDYHFIELAYGKSVSFLFGWARISVITTGSIALLAFVFGDYMERLCPISIGEIHSGPFTYAVLIILILSWLNICNFQTGIKTQTVLTFIQIGSLILIVAGAVYLVLMGNQASPAPTQNSSGFNLSDFGMAMVFVLLTFGGWNEAAYISAELENGRKNMVKALVFSIAIITVLYLAVAWAYCSSLGFDGLSQSHAVAADFANVVFGSSAEKILSIMVALSAITSINATIIVGARSSFSMGQDWSALHFLGKWHPQRNTPVNALYVQCIASVFLVILGALTGGGFNAMVEFTAPVFWLFFLLTGIALFILRRHPRAEASFQVPLYPVLPLIFCLTCAYMLWSSLSYVSNQSFGGFNAAWIGVAVLLIGVILLGIIRYFTAKSDHYQTTSHS